MVAPRAPVPLDKLDRLVKNRFTVYVRLRPNSVYNNFVSFQRLLSFFSANISISSDWHNIQVQMTKDVRDIVATSDVFTLTNKISVRYTEEEQRSLDLLCNHSNLLPGTLERFSEDFLSSTVSQTTIDVSDVHSYFRHLDNIKINKALEDCANVAVLLPHTASLGKAKRLSKMHLSGTSYLGKETWFASDISNGLTEFVTGNILKRKGGLGQSGIWQWWEETLSEMNQNLENSTGSRGVFMKRPTMDGNIMIIFSVWLIGLGLAIVEFIFEAGKGSVRI